jgi:hypothetical protein
VRRSLLEIQNGAYVDALANRLTKAEADTYYAPIGTTGGGGGGVALPSWVASQQSAVTLTGFGGDLAQSRVTGLVTALAGKASTTDVSGLKIQAQFLGADGKFPAQHITGFILADRLWLDDIAPTDTPSGGIYIHTDNVSSYKIKVCDGFEWLDLDGPDLTSLNNKTQFLTSSGLLPVGKIYGEITADRLLVDQFEPATADDGDVFIQYDGTSSYTLKVSDGTAWHEVGIPTDLTALNNKTQFLTASGKLPSNKITGKIRADTVAVDFYDPVAQGEEGDIAFVKESGDNGITTYTLKVSDGVSMWLPVAGGGGGTTDLSGLNNKTQLLNSSGLYSGTIAQTQVTDLSSNIAALQAKTANLNANGALTSGSYILGPIRATHINMDTDDPLQQPGYDGKVYFNTPGYDLRVNDGTEWRPARAQANSVQVASTAPQNPIAGTMYFDSSLNKLFVHNGTTWLDMSGGGGGGTTQPVTDPYVSLTSAVTLANSRTVLTNVALPTEAITFAINFGSVVPTGVVLEVKADSQNTTNPFTNATGTSNTAITVASNTFTPTVATFPHTAAQNYVWFKLQYTHESTPFTRYGVLTTRLYPQGGSIAATVSVDQDSFIVNTITDYALVFAPDATSLSYRVENVVFIPTVGISGSFTITAPKVATYGPSTCAANDNAFTGLTAGTVYNEFNFTIVNPLGVSTNITKLINLLARPDVTLTGAVNLATGHDVSLNYIARQDEQITVTVGNLGSAEVTSVQVKADITGVKANNPFEIASTTATAAYTLLQNETANEYRLPPNQLVYSQSQNYLWYYATIAFGSQTFTYTGVLRTATPKTIRLYQLSDNVNECTFEIISSTAIPATHTIDVLTIKDYLSVLVTTQLTYNVSVTMTPAVADVSGTLTATGAGVYAFVTATMTPLALALAPGASYTNATVSITNALGYVAVSSQDLAPLVVSPVTDISASITYAADRPSVAGSFTSHICREDETLTITETFSSLPTSTTARIRASDNQSSVTSWVVMGGTVNTSTTRSQEIIPSVTNLPHTAAQNYVFVELTITYNGVAFTHTVPLIYSNSEQVRLYPQGNTGGSEVSVVVDQQGLSGADLQTKCRVKVSAIKDYVYTLVKTGGVVGHTVTSLAFTPSATVTLNPTSITLYGYRTSTFAFTNTFDSTIGNGSYINEVIVSGLTQNTSYTSLAFTMYNPIVTGKVISAAITLTTASTAPAFANTNSAVFDGTTQYGTNSLSYLTGAWSLSIWAKAASIPTGADIRFIFDGRKNGGTGEAFELSQSSTGINSIGAYTSSFNDLGWHHFLYTSNGTNLGTLYEDGIAKKTTSNANPLVLREINFGIRHSKDIYKFIGKLDEASVWNVALTAAEVGEIWNSGVPGNLATHSRYTNLQAWWRFSGNGQDSSTYLRHLNMTAGVTYSTDVKS